eukprot:3233522-Prymnesium_polylepis.1
MAIGLCIVPRARPFRVCSVCPKWRSDVLQARCASAVSIHPGEGRVRPGLWFAAGCSASFIQVKLSVRVRVCTARPTLSMTNP